ncbi:HD domain-containing protein [Patescibacteria group bacterium]|nr:HD domain-containing protein [Patescibacteria group bacterium]MCG2693289.1 HD domain-containing protein [Candidatus Parcubacteria bacterium]
MLVVITINKIKTDWETEKYQWIKPEQIKKYKTAPDFDKIIEKALTAETMTKKLDKLNALQIKLEKNRILDFVKKLPKTAEVYLVGGAVRDALLDWPDSGDYDFVVRNVSAKNLEKTLAKLGQVDFVGKKFGVFKFIPKNTQLKEALDIALPRTEHSLGTGAYRDFKVKSNPKLKIEDDLSRRDFTINAMGYRVKKTKKQKNKKTSCSANSDGENQKIIDPANGLADLQAKTIRTVGNPQDRFSEDYSRMLRAIRFNCQLSAKGGPALRRAPSPELWSVGDQSFGASATSGWKIEKQTWTAVKKLIPRINDVKNKERIVPYEVIASELLKAFTHNPVRALELLDESGAMKSLMPELLKMKGCPQPKNWHSEGDAWVHTKLALSLLQSKDFQREFRKKRSDTDCHGFKTDSYGSLIDPELVLAVLLHDIGKPCVVKTPEKDGTDRIRFHGHEKEGVHLTRKICKRLKLQTPPEFDVDCERMVSMVGKHLLCVNSKIETMKNATIVKYFIRHPRLGENFMKLFWLDAMASVPEVGKSDLSHYKKLKKRINQLKKSTFKSTIKICPAKIKLDSRGRFKAVINGDDIMKEFKIKPGKKVGELLDLVREEQLAGRVRTKKEAIDFLEKKLKTQ